MKIENDIRWPFYSAYHEDRYIEHHGTRRNVSLREKREKSKYILRNDSEKDLVIYRIDGGIITSKRLRNVTMAFIQSKMCYILLSSRGQIIVRH